MSQRIPDFTKVAFGEVTDLAPAAAAPWQTPEAIAVKGAYQAADLDGIPWLDSYQIGRAHV